jgi:hypothetical protein
MSHYVTHQVPAVDTSQLVSKTLPGLTSGFNTCTGVLGTDTQHIILVAYKLIMLHRIALYYFVSTKQSSCNVILSYHLLK